MISILLAEDDTQLSALYKTILDRAFSGKVTLDTVANGVDAVKKIQEGNKYDVIIMDTEMPLLNGIASAHQIKKLGFNKPILAHTTFGLKEAEDAILDGVVNGFTLKSSNGKDLIKVIKKLVSV